MCVRLYHLAVVSLKTRRGGVKGRGNTLNRLLSPEIMRHGLNPRSQLSNLFDHTGQILQNQPSRSLGHLCVKLFQIVAPVTADIHQKHIIGSVARAGEELLAHRVEVRVHPAGSALVVGGHQAVELRCEVRVCTHELKEMEIGAEAQVEGGLFVVCWGSVAIGLEPLGDRVDGWYGASVTVGKQVG